MGDEQATHRPTSFNRANKAHKTGRHRSKGEIKKSAGGKLQGRITKAPRKVSKVNKRLEQAQLRKLKRESALAAKKELGGNGGPPFMVCIVPMHMLIDPKSVLAILEKCHESNYIEDTECGIKYIRVQIYKKNFAFVCPPIGPGNELEVLDCLKACDTTLLVMSAYTNDEIFDKWGSGLFNMMLMQGIPTPMPVLMDLESLNPKDRKVFRKDIQSFVSKLLPNSRVFKLDTNDEGLNLVRRIGSQKRHMCQYQLNRPHLISDAIELVTDDNNTQKDECMLKVTGFLRGISLSVNNLVHIVGLGDFQMSEIMGGIKDFENITQAHDSVCFKADPEKQTSLESEATPDEMDADQTWPTWEEIKESQMETMQLIHKKQVDYERVARSYDMDSIADSIASKDEQADKENAMSIDNITTAEDLDKEDAQYDLDTDYQEEREMLKKIKEERTDQQWPDEIDTPKDVLARIRFQKYRGLESFNATKWDPNENLPLDYARIFKFRNFNEVRRRVMAEAKEVIGPHPGCYITITVQNVCLSKWQEFRNEQVSKHIVIFGLLPHEHRMSVVNVTLKRSDPESVVPIKSKDPLFIQCGYRRYSVNPIFSEHTQNNKFKFERYFRPHTTVCATFYAPIQYPPSPVLAFMMNPDSTLKLVAHGTLLSCNADRLIIKRIVLSGYPMHIHTKSATIRYMFFNKDDVNYFKPITLRTRCGRVGHIKKSLGTHGHMKCVFDGRLRSHDTVFMYLYKRVFPKWTYNHRLLTVDDYQELPSSGNDGHTMDNTDENNTMEE